MGHSRHRSQGNVCSVDLGQVGDHEASTKTRCHNRTFHSLLKVDEAKPYKAGD